MIVRWVISLVAVWVALPSGAVAFATYEYDVPATAVQVAHTATPTTATLIGDPARDRWIDASGATSGLRLAPGSSTSAISLRRAAKAERGGGGALNACGLRSFSGDTRVLMADGTSKPISELRAGDLVVAADPITGIRAARRVTRVWVHDDTLLDLKIGDELVTTTEDHPFWNATDGEWQDVSEFDLGDEVLTANGERIRIGGFRAGSAHAGPAYNLTVEGLHTYFVAAGDESVLVHNANLRPCEEWADDFMARSGGERVTIKPRGGRVLGPVKGYPPGDWRYHVAVRKGGRIYDERNPGGVTPEEYMSQFKYRDAIDFGGM